MIPFDPVWAAFEHRSSGKTLREVLEAWGLSDLIQTAQAYIARVESYRANAKRVDLYSPERTTAFQGDRLQFGERYKYFTAFEKIGGWENFITFIRVWAFLLPDWQDGLRLYSFSFSLITVLVTINSEPATPFLILSCPDTSHRRFAVPVDHINLPKDYLLGEYLIYFSEEILPGELYLLDLEGRTDRLIASMDRISLQNLLENLATLGSQGPYPPLVGLSTPNRCSACGFHSVCWKPTSSRKANLSPLALDF